MNGKKSQDLKTGWSQLQAQNNSNFKHFSRLDLKYNNSQQQCQPLMWLQFVLFFLKASLSDISVTTSVHFTQSGSLNKGR